MYIDEEDPGELLSEQYFTCRVLSMHRPEQANALGTNLARKLARAVAGMDSGAVTSFFVVRGSVVDGIANKVVVNERDKFFCTGVDLLALRQAWKAGHRNRVFDYYRSEADLISTLVNCRKPWASGMDGSVFGAGAGVAMHALFRFATDTTVWALPETSYGAVPGYGFSYQLPNLEGELGTYLALTGRRLVGHDLLWAGLASNMVDPFLYGDLCMAVTHQNSTEMQFLAPVVASFDSQRSLQEEPFVLAPHMETIEKCFRRNSIEQIREALEADGSAFAKLTREKLAHKSEASLKLTLRLLRLGRERNDIVESLQAEHCVMTRLWEDEQSDLHAGLSQVVFAPDKSTSAPVFPTKATDEYVERMMAAPRRMEVLKLAPLAPRPPTEAPQLLRYHEDVYSINTAPELDPNADARVNDVVPEDDKTSLVSASDLKNMVESNMDSVLPPVQYWFVEEPAEGEQSESVQTTEAGEVFVARDVRTGNAIVLPESVKTELLDKHANLRKLNIFTVESYDVHPDINMESESQVNALISALRQQSGLPALEPGARRTGIVTSESMEETMSRRFFSADDEVAAVLKLVGHREKTPDETDVDAIPNYDNHVPRPDRTPLSKREKML